MKKLFIFLFSVILTMNCVNIAAQNPFCTLKGNPFVGNNPTTKEVQYERQKSYHSAYFDGEKCSFRLRLQDPGGLGWSSSNGINITVDGVDFGVVTLPWGEGDYIEIVKFLPSGEVQFTFIGEFNPVRHCFEIYNSLDELIYKSPYMGEFNPLFLIYQNECCIPLTDFEGAYIIEENQVNLSWTAPTSVDLTGFDIFRNEALIKHVDLSTISYTDNTAYLATGDYKYCVKPAYPFLCTFEEECFETYIELGIKNYASLIDIYPNPANNIVNIVGADVAIIQIFNCVGQLILNQYNTNTINVSTLQNGLYLLTIELTTGQTTQKKLIINN